MFPCLAQAPPVLRLWPDSSAVIWHHQLYGDGLPKISNARKIALPYPC